MPNAARRQVPDPLTCAQPSHPPDRRIDALVARPSRAIPFSVLGPHPGDAAQAVVVRVLQPAARDVTLRVTCPRGRTIPMAAAHAHGLFEAVVPGAAEPVEALRLPAACRPIGWATVERDDPYRYGRVLTDFDLHLFGEGTHLRASRSSARTP